MTRTGTRSNGKFGHAWRRLQRQQESRIHEPHSRCCTCCPLASSTSTPHSSMPPSRFLQVLRAARPEQGNSARPIAMHPSPELLRAFGSIQAGTPVMLHTSGEELARRDPAVGASGITGLSSSRSASTSESALSVVTSELLSLNWEQVARVLPEKQQRALAAFVNALVAVESQSHPGTTARTAADDS